MESTPFADRLFDLLDMNGDGHVVCLSFERKRRFFFIVFCLFFSMFSFLLFLICDCGRICKSLCQGSRWYVRGLLKKSFFFLFEPMIEMEMDILMRFSFLFFSFQKEEKRVKFCVLKEKIKTGGNDSII